MDIRNDLFTRSIGQQWNRLPRDVVNLCLCKFSILAWLDKATKSDLVFAIDLLKQDSGLSERSSNQNFNGSVNHTASEQHTRLANASP